MDNHYGSMGRGEIPADAVRLVPRLPFIHKETGANISVTADLGDMGYVPQGTEAFTVRDARRIAGALVVGAVRTAIDVGPDAARHVASSVRKRADIIRGAFDAISEPSAEPTVPPTSARGSFLDAIGDPRTRR